LLAFYGREAALVVGSCLLVYGLFWLVIVWEPRAAGLGGRPVPSQFPLLLTAALYPFVVLQRCATVERRILRGRWPLPPWQPGRHYLWLARRAAAGCQDWRARPECRHSLSWDEGGLTHVSALQSGTTLQRTETRFAWSDVKAVEDAGRLVFFHTVPSPWAVPRRAFPTPEAFEEFLGEVRKRSAFAGAAAHESPTGPGGGTVPADPAGETERPWEQPGAIRRDCSPHRGPLLLALGTVAGVCGAFAVCLPAVLVALPLGAAARRMAARDLEGMAAGRVDPEGRVPTERAHYWAGVAVLCGPLGFVLGFVTLLLALLDVLP
jgi:hypothetical protein